jgi:CheY-like chemotaxis protein
MAKPLILIVDDEEDVVTLWQRSLLMEGYEVVSAFDGIAALDIAETERPSLILLDIMMPMMSGYDVCRQLKANPATHDIPVLCVTSAQNPEVAQNARIAGAQGILIKPFTTQELIAQIGRFLPTGPSAQA